MNTYVVGLDQEKKKVLQHIYLLMEIHRSFQVCNAREELRMFK